MNETIPVPQGFIVGGDYEQRKTTITGKMLKVDVHKHIDTSGGPEGRSPGADSLEELDHSFQ